MSDELEALVASLRRRGVTLTLTDGGVEVDGWPKVRDHERRQLREQRDDLADILDDGPDVAPEQPDGDGVDVGEDQDISDRQPPKANTAPGLCAVGQRITWDPVLGRRVETVYEDKRHRQIRELRALTHIANSIIGESREARRLRDRISRAWERADRRIQRRFNQED